MKKLAANERGTLSSRNAASQQLGKGNLGAKNSSKVLCVSKCCRFEIVQLSVVYDDFSNNDSILDAELYEYNPVDLGVEVRTCEWMSPNLRYTFPGNTPCLAIASVRPGGLAAASGFKKNDYLCWSETPETSCFTGQVKAEASAFWSFMTEKQLRTQIEFLEDMGIATFFVARIHRARRAGRRVVPTPSNKKIPKPRKPRPPKPAVQVQVAPQEKPPPDSKQQSKETIFVAGKFILKKDLNNDVDVILCRGGFDGGVYAETLTEWWERYEFASHNHKAGVCRQVVHAMINKGIRFLTKVPLTQNASRQECYTMEHRSSHKIFKKVLRALRSEVVKQLSGLTSEEKVSREIILEKRRNELQNRLKLPPSQPETSGQSMQTIATMARLDAMTPLEREVNIIQTNLNLTRNIPGRPVAQPGVITHALFETKTKPLPLDNLAPRRPMYQGQTGAPAATAHNRYSQQGPLDSDRDIVINGINLNQAGLMKSIRENWDAYRRTPPDQRAKFCQTLIDTIRKTGVQFTTPSASGELENSRIVQETVQQALDAMVSRHARAAKLKEQAKKSPTGPLPGAPSITWDHRYGTLVVPPFGMQPTQQHPAPTGASSLPPPTAGGANHHQPISASAKAAKARAMSIILPRSAVKAPLPTKPPIYEAGPDGESRSAPPDEKAVKVAPVIQKEDSPTIAHVSPAATVAAKSGGKHPSDTVLAEMPKKIQKSGEGH